MSFFILGAESARSRRIIITYLTPPYGSSPWTFDRVSEASFWDPREDAFGRSYETAIPALFSVGVNELDSPTDTTWSTDTGSPVLTTGSTDPFSGSSAITVEDNESGTYGIIASDGGPNVDSGEGYTWVWAIKLDPSATHFAEVQLRESLATRLGVDVSISDGRWTIRTGTATPLSSTVVIIDGWIWGVFSFAPGDLSGTSVAYTRLWAAAGVTYPSINTSGEGVTTFYGAHLGVSRLAANDVFPWIPDDIPRVFSDRSILIESARTNAFENSEDMTDPPLTHLNSPVVTTGSTTAPDGTLADFIEFAAGGALGQVRDLMADTLFTNGASSTVSFFAKDADSADIQTIFRDLELTNSFSTHTLTPEWTRYSYLAANGSGSSDPLLALYESDDAADFHAWGLQVEPDKVAPSSPIRTAGAIATRADEDLKLLAADGANDLLARLLNGVPFKLDVWPTIQSTAGDSNATVFTFGLARLRLYRAGTAGGDFYLQYNGATTACISTLTEGYDAGDHLRFTISTPQGGTWTLRVDNLTTGESVTDDSAGSITMSPATGYDLFIGNYANGNFWFPGVYSPFYRGLYIDPEFELDIGALPLVRASEASLFDPRTNTFAETGTGSAESALSTSDLSTGWTTSGLTSSTADVDGVADEIGDTGAGLTVFFRTVTLTDMPGRAGLSVKVKQDTDQTRFPEFGIDYNSLDYRVQLNTETGATAERIISGPDNRISTVTDDGAGYWLLTMEADFAGGTSLVLRIFPAISSVIGSTSSSVTGSIIVKEVNTFQKADLAWKGVDQPRTLLDDAVLFEGERTNLVANSDDFTSVWAYSGTPTYVTSSNLAPDGSSTMYTLGDDQVGSNSYFWDVLTTDVPTLGETISVSGYFRKDADNTTFPVLAYDSGSLSQRLQINTSTGEVADIGANALETTFSKSAGDFWRVGFSMTASAASAHQIRVFPAFNESWGSSTTDVAVTRSVDVWGLQVEHGFAPSTSLIRTYQATGTRDADVLALDGALIPRRFLVGGFEVDVWPEYASTEIVGNPTIFWANAGDAYLRLGEVNTAIKTDAGPADTISTPAFSAGDKVTFRVDFNAGLFSIFVNNVAAGTTAIANTWAPVLDDTTCWIGCDSNTGNNPINGAMSKWRHIPLP